LSLKFERQKHPTTISPCTLVILKSVQTRGIHVRGLKGGGKYKDLAHDLESLTQVML
jgi:hypothetical protein